MEFTASIVSVSSMRCRSRASKNESVRFAPVTTLQWLLGFHVTGAFLFLGGIVMAGIFGVLAQRAQRPSEVAAFLGLTRVAVPFIVLGAVMSLGFGLWLVNCAGYSYTAPWIVASLLLLAGSAIAGRLGGAREGETRRLALRLAADGDEPELELGARMRDLLTLALSMGRRSRRDRDPRVDDLEARRVRPELQLFLHIAAATALFGAIGALCVLGLGTRGLVEHGPVAKAALATTIAVAVPAWMVMLVFGSWTKSKEGLSGSIDWVRIPNAIALAGIAVLLSASAISYAWLRRPASRGLPLALGLLAAGYLVALGVAWWLMSAKG